MTVIKNNVLVQQKSKQSSIKEKAYTTKQKILIIANTISGKQQMKKIFTFRATVIC